MQIETQIANPSEIKNKIRSEERIKIRQSLSFFIGSLIVLILGALLGPQRIIYVWWGPAVFSLIAIVNHVNAYIFPESQYKNHGTTHNLSFGDVSRKMLKLLVIDILMGVAGFVVIILTITASFYLLSQLRHA